MGKIKIGFYSICLLLVGLTVSDASALEKAPSIDYQVSTNHDVLADGVAVVYTSQIGVRELSGHNDGVVVEKYLASTGFKKGNAWCAAFITWSFEQASNEMKINIRTPKSAWAPSWFPPDNVIYYKGKFTKHIPDKADVFGIYYAKDNRIGHVGFIDVWPDGDYVITVEGNTNNAGSREGDGVYRKRRLKTNIHKVSRWV
jgi:hypothetical protein